MAGRKKGIKEKEVIMEIPDDDEKEEVIEEVKEEVVEEEKKDIYEGDAIDVPIDESFYKPVSVKLKEIAEDGTYKITDVNLARKKADLNFGLDSQDVLARKAAHWDNVNDKKGSRTTSGIVLSKIFTIFNLLCFGIAAWLISVGAFSKCFFILIVTTNIIVGIVQDLRAKAMIDKL